MESQWASLKERDARSAGKGSAPRLTKRDLKRKSRNLEKKLVATLMAVVMSISMTNTTAFSEELSTSKSATPVATADSSTISGGSTDTSAAASDDGSNSSLTPQANVSTGNYKYELARNGWLAAGSNGTLEGHTNITYNSTNKMGYAFVGRWDSATSKYVKDVSTASSSDATSLSFRDNSSNMVVNTDAPFVVLGYTLWGWIPWVDTSNPIFLEADASYTQAYMQSSLEKSSTSGSSTPIDDNLTEFSYTSLIDSGVSVGFIGSWTKTSYTLSFKDKTHSAEIMQITGDAASETGLEWDTKLPVWQKPANSKFVNAYSDVLDTTSTFYKNPALWWELPRGDAHHYDANSTVGSFAVKDPANPKITDDPSNLIAQSNFTTGQGSNLIDLYPSFMVAYEDASGNVVKTAPVDFDSTSSKALSYSAAGVSGSGSWSVMSGGTSSVGTVAGDGTGALRVAAANATSGLTVNGTAATVDSNNYVVLKAGGAAPAAVDANKVSFGGVKTSDGSTIATNLKVNGTALSGSTDYYVEKGKTLGTSSSGTQVTDPSTATTTKFTSTDATTSTSGYTFAGWIIGDDTSKTYSSTDILNYQPSAATTIKAYFTKDAVSTYGITLGSKTEGGGSLQTAPSLTVNGSASTSFKVKQGDTLTSGAGGESAVGGGTTTKVTALASTPTDNGQYQFAGWIIGNDTSTVYTNSTILAYKPTADATINAYYTLKTYSITIAQPVDSVTKNAISGASASGTNLTGVKSGSTLPGSSTITITPASNYILSGWEESTDGGTTWSAVQVAGHEDNASDLPKYVAITSATTFRPVMAQCYTVTLTVKGSGTLTGGGDTGVTTITRMVPAGGTLDASALRADLTTSATISAVTTNPTNSVFDKWYLGADPSLSAMPTDTSKYDNGTKDIFHYLITGNTTFTAAFTDTYAMTWTKGTGVSSLTGTPTATWTAGDSTTTPTLPTATAATGYSSSPATYTVTKTSDGTAIGTATDTSTLQALLKNITAPVSIAVSLPARTGIGYTVVKHFEMPDHSSTVTSQTGSYSTSTVSAAGAGTGTFGGTVDLASADLTLPSSVSGLSTYAAANYTGLGDSNVSVNLGKANIQNVLSSVNTSTKKISVALNSVDASSNVINVYYYLNTYNVSVSYASNDAGKSAPAVPTTIANQAGAYRVGQQISFASPINATVPGSVSADPEWNAANTIDSGNKAIASATYNTGSPTTVAANTTFKMPAADVAVAYTWAPVTKSVYYSVGVYDGTNVSEADAKGNALSVTKASVPVASPASAYYNGKTSFTYSLTPSTGYRFKGWYYATSSNTDFGAVSLLGTATDQPNNQTITSNVKFVAVFEKIPVTTAFSLSTDGPADARGTTNFSSTGTLTGGSTSVNYGDKPTYPTYTTSDNKVYDGGIDWYVKNDDSGTWAKVDVATFTVTDKEHVLKGVPTLKSYTVTFVADGVNCTATAKSYTGYYGQPLTSFKDSTSTAYSAGAVSYTPTEGKTLQANGWDWTTTNPSSGSATWTNQSADPGSNPIASITANTWYRANYTAGAVKYYVQRFYQDAPSSVGAAATYTAGSQEEVASATVGSTLLFKNLVSAHKFATGIDTSNLPNGVDGAAFTNGADPSTVTITGSTSSYSDATATGSTLSLTMAESAGGDSPNVIKLYYMRNAGLTVGYGWQTTDKDDFSGTGTFVSTTDRPLPSNKSNVVYGTKVTLPGYDEGAGTTVPADINDYVHFQGWKVTQNGTTTIIKKSEVTSANCTVAVDADTTITGYWYRDNITVKFQLRDADKSIATFTDITGLTQQSVKYGDSIVTTASGKTLADQVSMNSGNTKYHNGWTNGTADAAPTVTVTSAINTSNFNIDSGTVNLYAKFSDGYQIQYLQGASPVNGAVKVGTWATDDKTFTVAPNAALTPYDADNIPNDGEYLAGYTFLGWTWTEGADTTKYFYSPGNQTTPSGYTQKSLPATTADRTFTAVWSAKTLGVMLAPTLSKTGKDDAGNSLIGDASANTSLKSDYTVLHNGTNTDVSPDTSYTLPTATQLTRTGYTLAGYEFVQSSTQLGDQSRGTNLNTRITGSGTDADPWQVYIGAPTSCTVVPVWHRVQNNVTFTYAAQSGSNIDKLLSSSISGKTVVNPSALAKTDAQYGTAMTVGDGITATAIPVKGDVVTFTDTDNTTYSYTFMGWTAQPTSKTGETVTIKDDNTYTMPGDSLAVVGTWKLTEYPVTFAASVINTDETVSGKVQGSGATQQVQHNGKVIMDNVTTSVVDGGGAAKNGYKIDHWEKTVGGSTTSLGKNTDGDPISPITVGITAVTTFTAVYVPDDNVDYTVNVYKQYVKADGSLDYALATFTGHDGKVGTQMKEQAKVWELASWPDAGATYPIPAGYSLNSASSTNTKYVTPAINPDDTSKNVLNVYFDIATNVQYSIVRYYQNADGTSYSAGISDASPYTDGRTGESKTLTGSVTKAKYTPANDSSATADDKWAAGSVAATDLYTVHDSNQLTATIKGDGTTEYAIYYDRVLFPVTFTCTLDTDVSSQPETTPVSDKARWGSTSATSTGAGSTVYASHLPWNKNYVVGQYTFTGWSDKATVNPVTVTTDNIMQVMPARQVDLTGQWGTTPYTVTYAASLSDTTGVTVNSTNGADKETVFSGKYPTMSTFGDTSQTGTSDYTITGWTYSVDGVDKGSVPVPEGYAGTMKDLPKTVKITNNTTFYATWGKKAYTVQYAADIAAAYNWTAATVKWSNVKSGTALTSYAANFSTSATGAGITDYIPKAASGYTFQGWDWAEAGKEYCTVNDTAHSAAYANYVAKYGDTFKVASPDHWSDVLAQIAIGKSGAATTSTGDITFTAVTSQNTYNVEYYSTLNPTINPDTSKTYTRFTDLNTSNGVNMSGSKGLKWGDHIYQPSVTSDFLTNAVAVSGYTFAGWYTNPNCGTGYEASHVWATDTVQNVAQSIPGLDTGGTIKLYAKYTANPVVITYVNSQDQNQKFTDPASGSADAAGSVKVGNTYLTQSKPDEWVYAGHKFLGWTTTSLGDIDSAYVASFGTHAGKDFTPNSTEYTIQAAGNTFYAVWGEISYNIEFNSGSVTYDTASNPLYALTNSITGATTDNTSIKGISYTSGVNLAGIPTALETAGNAGGKSFLGWSLTAATNQSDAKVQMYGAAQNTDGSSLQSIYQAVSGNNSFAITDGYTFKLTAVWADTYKVIYHANGGTVSGSAVDVVDSLTTEVDKDSATGKYLTDIKSAPASLAREGYTFAGWSTDSTSKTPMYTGGETGHEITGTTNLYAVWTPATTSLTVQRFLQNPDTGAYPTTPNAIPATVAVSYESDGTTKLVTGQTYQRTGLKYANDSIDMSKYDIDTAKSDASIQLKGTAASNVLKVYYKLKTYTVSYKYTGTDGVDAAPTAPVDSTIYRVGQSVSTKAVPSITNDAVVLPDGAAWADQATGSDAVTISGGSFSMPNRNVTLYIQLAKKPYTVSYVAGSNGSLKLTNSEAVAQNIASGTQVDSETVTWGSKPQLKLTNGTYAGDTVAPAPANGYAFIYWSWTDASGNPQTAKDITATETATIKGNTVFTANYAPSFTVTYHNDTVGDDFSSKSYSNLNGVSGEDLVSAPGADVTGSADSSVTTPKHLDGYEFKGWHVQASNLVGSDWTLQDPASVKYTTWSEDPNGGTLDEVKAGTKEYVITTMSALIATKAMGDYDFYSVYDAQDYTALFDANGGTIDALGETTPATDSKTSSVTKTVGTSINRPSATRPGFTFAGWKLVEENGTAVSGGKTYQSTDIISMKFGGMKLQAVWTVADADFTYAIASASNGRGSLTMNLVSATNPETVSNTIGSAAPVGATVVPNPGYDFEKWTSGKNPASDLASMGWSKSSATITNGNSIVPQKVDGIVPDPSNAAATVSAYQSDTFYASFTPKKYTATFVADADGHSTVTGAATTQSDLPYNTTSIKAKNGSVDNYKVNAVAGYEWTGSWKYTIQCEAASQSDTVTAGEAWDVNTKTITGTTTDPTGVVVRGNVSFVPVMIESSHTLTLDYTLSSHAKETFTLKTNATKVLPDVTDAQYIPEGYTFGGWTVHGGDGTVLKAGDTYTMPTTDVTLDAVWKGKTYYITYLPNGGTKTASGSESYTVPVTYNGGAVTTMDSGTFLPGEGANNGITVPSFAREFTTWSSNANGTGDYVVAGDGTFTMPAHDVTLYANWQNKKYKLTLDRNGGADGTNTSTQYVYDKDAATDGTQLYEYGDKVTLPYINKYSAEGVQQYNDDGTPKYDFWSAANNNYKFNMWYDTSDGAGTKVSYAGTPGNMTVTIGADNEFKNTVGAATSAITDVTLYANWNYSADSGSNKYCVVYYGADGNLLGQNNKTTFVDGSNMGTYQLVQNIYKDQADVKDANSNVTKKFLGWALMDSATGAAKLDANGKPIITVTNGTTLHTAAMAQDSSNWQDGKPAFLTDGLKDGVPEHPLNLIAVYQVSNYTVHFNDNASESEQVSGTCPDESFTWGTAKDLNKNIYARNGYSFMGWSTTPGATAVTNANLKADSNGVVTYNTGLNGELASWDDADNQVTLYAVWSELNNYVVRYVSDYDDSTQMVQTWDTSAYKWTANPANLNRTPVKELGTDKSAYTFEGWYAQKDGAGLQLTSSGSSYDQTIKQIAENQGDLYNNQTDKTIVYLYAKWTKTGWGVNFDVTPGSDPKPEGDANRAQKAVTAAAGSNIVSPTTDYLTYEGYAPNGWIVDANGDGSYDASFDAGGNYTGSDVYVASSGTVEYNNAKIQAALADGGYAHETRKLNACAYYINKSYTVNYNLNIGADPSTQYAWPSKSVSGNPQEVKANTGLKWTGQNYVGAAYTTAPTRDGYTFDGWYSDKTALVYAHPETYGYENNKSTWTVKDLATLQAANGTPNYNTTDYSLYAKWNMNSSYTVKYNLGGGKVSTDISNNKFDSSDQTGLSWIAAQTANGYTLIPADNAASRSGYEFEGWYLTSDFKDGSKLTSGASFSYGKLAETLKAIDSAAGANAVADNGNVTLYAHWIEKTVPITYALDNTDQAKLYSGSSATGIAQTSVVQDNIGGATGANLAPVTAKAVPGYKITGWKATVDGAEGEETYTVGTSSDVNPDSVLMRNADGSWTLDLSKMAAAHHGNLGEGWVKATYQVQTAPAEVDYTVNYYKQNADGTWNAVPDATTTRQGTTGTDATYLDPDDVAKYQTDGYTLNTGVEGTVSSATVKGDGSTALKLYYTANPFKVTYKYSDDNAKHPSPAPAISNSEAVVNAGAAYTLRTDAPASVFGWTFDGWDKNHVVVTYVPFGQSTAVTLADDAWSSDGTSFTMPKGDVTITSTWTRGAFDATFVHTVDGGAVFDPVPALTIADAAQDKDFVQKVPAGDKASMTDANRDGTVNDAIGVNLTEAQKSQYVVEWKYEFTSGPNQGSMGTTTDPSSIQVTGNITFTPTVSKKNVVSYHPGVGVNGETVGTFASIEKVYSDTDATTKQGATRYVSLPSTYGLDGVDYQYGGATELQAVTINGVSTYQNVPTHIAGYDFAGWKWENLTTKDVGTTQGVKASLNGTLSDSIALTAQWSPQTHALTLDVKGGTPDMSITSPSGSHKTGDKVSLPAAGIVTKDGYKLTGWAVKGDTSGTVYQPGDEFVMPAVDVVLEAQWQSVPIVLNYQPNDAAMGSVSPTSETILSTATNPLGSVPAAKAGYHFVNWTAVNSGTFAVDANKKITPTHPADGAFANGTTYQANFAPNVYKVTFDSATGGYMNTTPPYTTEQQVAYKAKANKDIVQAKPNKDTTYFKSWTYTMQVVQSDGSTVEKKGEVANVDDVAIEGVTEFTAQWYLGGIYSVAYDTNGGTPINKKAVQSIKDTGLLAPSNATSKPGYTFQKWVYDTDNTPRAQSAQADASNTFSFEKMWNTAEDRATNTVTLHAQWIENSNYKVVYDSNGGSSVGANVLPADTAYDSITQTLTGVKWVNTIGFANSVLVAAVAVPVRTGYTFEGWQVQKADGSLVDGVVSADQNYSNLAAAAGESDPASITLVAKWTPKSYTIVYYDVNGKTVTQSVGWNYKIYDQPINDEADKEFNTWAYDGTNLAQTDTSKMTVDVANNPSATYGDVAGNDSVSEIHVVSTWANLVNIYNEYHMLKAVNTGGTWTSVDTYDATDPVYCVKSKVVQGSQAYGTFKSFPGYNYTGDDHAEIKVNGTKINKSINDGIVVTDNDNSPHFIRYYMENTDYLVTYDGNDTDQVTNSKGEKTTVKSSVTPEAYPDQEMQLWTSENHVPTTEPTRPGYDFIGWNTQPDGKGALDSAGAIKNVTNDNTFGTLTYKKQADGMWKQVDPNDSNDTKKIGTDGKLHGYQTLYAQWQQKHSQINYDVATNDGSINGGKIRFNTTETDAQLSTAERTELITAITGKKCKLDTDGKTLIIQTEGAEGAKAVANPGWHFVNWTVEYTLSGGNTLNRNPNMGIEPASISGASVDDGSLSTMAATGGEYSKLNSILPGVDNSESLYVTANYYAHFEKNDNGTIIYNNNPPLKKGSKTDHELVSGTVDNTVAPFGSTVPLRLNTEADGGAYTTTYYVVGGWDTKPHDPSEAGYGAPDYKLGDPIVMPEGVTTLYAHWVPRTFVVTIADGNNGSGRYVYGGTQDVAYGNPPIDKNYGTPDYWTVTYTDPITGRVIELPGRYTSLTDIPVYGDTTITPHWDRTTTTTTTTTIVSNGNGTGSHGAFWLPKTGDTLSLMPFTAMLLMALSIMIAIVKRRRDEEEEEANTAVANSKHASLPRHTNQ